MWGEKLLDWFIACWAFFKFIEVVEEYQMGIVLRWGRYHRTIEPGRRWIIPFRIERAICENVVDKATPLSSQSLTTKDGKSVVLSAVVCWRVKDIRKFLLNVEGQETALVTAAPGCITRLVVRSTWEEASTDKFLDQVTTEVRAKARKHGIEVLEVSLRDLTTARSIRLWGDRNESAPATTVS
jgi:membrane protease subunit HflK